MKGEIRMQVHSPSNGDYTMTSNYHTACFPLPRRLKSDGAEKFVTDFVQDTSEDQSILPAQQNKIIQDIETATSNSGKRKKKKDDGAEPADFMANVEATAKAELEGAEPSAKKQKTEENDEEFRQFVELYKYHYKEKVDELKDYLR